MLYAQVTNKSNQHARHNGRRLHKSGREKRAREKVRPNSAASSSSSVLMQCEVSNPVQIRDRIFGTEDDRAEAVAEPDLRLHARGTGPPPYISGNRVA